MGETPPCVTTVCFNPRGIYNHTVQFNLGVSSWQSHASLSSGAVSHPLRDFLCILGAFTCLEQWEFPCEGSELPVSANDMMGSGGAAGSACFLLTAFDCASMRGRLTGSKPLATPGCLLPVKRALARAPKEAHGRITQAAAPHSFPHTQKCRQKSQF